MINGYPFQNVIMSSDRKHLRFAYDQPLYNKTFHSFYLFYRLNADNFYRSKALVKLTCYKHLYAECFESEQAD